MMDYTTVYRELRELRNQAWDKDADAGIIGDKIDELLNRLYDSEIDRIGKLVK